MFFTHFELKFFILRPFFMKHDKNIYLIFTKNLKYSRVLLWEIATLGQQPYPDYSIEEALQHILNGERLQKPRENCPEELWVHDSVG